MNGALLTVRGLKSRNYSLWKLPNQASNPSPTMKGSWAGGEVEEGVGLEGAGVVEVLLPVKLGTDVSFVEGVGVDVLLIIKVGTEVPFVERVGLFVSLTEMVGMEVPLEPESRQRMRLEIYRISSPTAGRCSSRTGCRNWLRHGGGQHWSRTPWTPNRNRGGCLGGSVDRGESRVDT